MTAPAGRARRTREQQAQRPVLSAAVAWSFLPYIAIAPAHVILLAVGNPLAGPTKLLLMPALAIPVIIALPGLRRRSAAVLLLAALLFSWLGDGAGVLFPFAPELPLMLGFFGIAHLAYIAVFARHLARRPFPWWALVYAVWWVGMLIALGPHTGALLIAVAVYGLVLAGTAAFSTRCGPVIATGGAFFLASDTILALRLFLPDSLPAWSNPTIMLTYTLGQGLIIAGALIALQRRSAA